MYQKAYTGSWKQNPKDFIGVAMETIENNVKYVQNLMDDC